MGLKDKLKNLKTPGRRKEPLWKGPESQDENGGITFSMLSAFLCCRERFRIKYIEGLKTADVWNHRIFYGHMWHVCEEWHAGYGGVMNDKEGGQTTSAIEAMERYAADLCRRYHFSQEDIMKWAAVCAVQFPIYVNYWSKNADVVQRTPLMQEQVFDVPYKLPSGRVVRLRGKFDSVDLIGKGRNAGVYLQENKTKGDVNVQQINRQMSYDLQTMLYAVAYRTWQDLDDYGIPIRTPEAVETPLKGIRFNVVRRPLSGGKGTIVQRKGSKNVPAETAEEYYARLAQYIRDEPHEYFWRWTVDISPADITKFRRECLDPILEQLCDWYSWIAVANGDVFSPDNGTENSIDMPVPSYITYRMPYGTYSSITEGATGDLDEHLATGSMVGLHAVETLFEELK